LIDFDNARPGPRIDDIGYALWKHLNLGLVDLSADQQARRARVFVDAYGADVDVFGAIELAHEQAPIRFTSHGWKATLEELAAESAWLAAHRTAFERR